ncbi:MAG: ROK family protein [Candidatus Hadarchaeaceae archaeon]
MAEKYAIGVDLGGTQVKAALSDDEGNFIAKLKERIDKDSAKAISNQIIRIARSLCSESGANSTDLKSIGIASTGPLDLRKGGLINPTNLPFKFVPLTKPISRELKIPALLVNDCIAGVLGEKVFGAGKGLDNLVYITQGTGIGGGAIVDGHLLSGKDGNAVEIGHIVIDYMGELKCGCGKRGHWEAYCSGKNIPNFVRMKLRGISKKKIRDSLLFKNVRGDFSKLSSEILFKSAKCGDDLSFELVEEIGRLNAVGFASVINAYDPSLITVGGSVALKNKKLVIGPIKKYVKDYTRNRTPRILITPLGEDVGIYGAIATVLKSKT